MQLGTWPSVRLPEGVRLRELRLYCNGATVHSGTATASFRRLVCHLMISWSSIKSTCISNRYIRCVWWKIYDEKTRMGPYLGHREQDILNYDWFSFDNKKVFYANSTFKRICLTSLLLFSQMLTNAALHTPINATKMPCAPIPRAHTSVVVKKDLKAMDSHVHVSKWRLILSVESSKYS